MQNLLRKSHVRQIFNFLVDLWNIMTSNNQFDKAGYFSETKLKGMNKIVEALCSFTKDPSVFEPIYKFTEHVS